jgi:hypothetical protein
MITYADDGNTLNPIEPHQREWALFFIFGLADLDADVEGWEHQVDWVRARFNSVDAWLGSMGDRHRQDYDWDNPSPEFVARWRRFKAAHASFVARWRRFKAAHASDTLADINKSLRTFLFDA